jgi:hypothetical protein
VFHRFGQAKFADARSILGSSKFTQLPQKIGALFKKGQNQVENNHLALLI